MIVRILLAIAILSSALHAQTYQIRGSNGGLASAVCLGVMRDETRKNPRWVFLTNRHFFRDNPRVWVGGEDKAWHTGQDVRVSSDQRIDLASFTVVTGEFKKIRVLQDVPNGTRAVVCGYTPSRKHFCFQGVIQNGQVLARGQHVWPGDSGGPVIVKGQDELFLAGLIYGYGIKDRNSWFASAAQISNHIQTSYGRTPRCVPWSQSRCPLPKPGGYRYERIDPQLLSPPRVERFEFTPEAPEPPEPPDPPSVDIHMLAEYLMKNYSAELRGERPDLDAIRERLSRLENRKRTIVLQEDGKEIDRQDYRDDQPIILDLQRFIRK